MEEFNERSLVTTADGSRTLFHMGVGEHYHSRHGAVGESKHVFVGMGLDYFLSESQNGEVSVLEIGFGTGLNFLLSAAHCRTENVRLDYCGIEAFPLEGEVLRELDYGQYTDPAEWTTFLEQYPQALAGLPVNVTPDCRLRIVSRPLLEVTLEKGRYDVVYFDAFAAVHQPEMWTREVFEKVAGWMAAGGVFVTYAITGELKRIMRDLGLQIEKLPGAPGKREMLRAVLSP